VTADSGIGRSPSRGAAPCRYTGTEVLP
jgi:hypothetical protein